MPQSIWLSFEPCCKLNGFRDTCHTSLAPKNRVCSYCPVVFCWIVSVIFRSALSFRYHIWICVWWIDSVMRGFDFAPFHILGICQYSPVRSKIIRGLRSTASLTELYKIVKKLIRVICRDPDPVNSPPNGRTNPKPAPRYFFSRSKACP